MQGKPYALIVDPDAEAANRVAMLVKFLGYDVEVASSVAGLDALLGGAVSPFIALVAADDEFELLATCIRMAAKQGSKHPTCLFAEGEFTGAVPPRLHTLFGGVISMEEGYGRLRDALEKAWRTCVKPAVATEHNIRNLGRHLVGVSDGIETVRSLIAQVACAEASVLITGESGTGKEVVAHSIHRLSQRYDGPFVPVNCGAIPAELLESELFGHEKGAFTGAISTRRGRFEVAEGGTLFLDEIGDMPMDMQVKLLRVLQERSFERVGSHKTIQANVRIVAATHQNLEQLVAEGKFRMDLLYRLNVFPVEIPPLRHRVGDIPMLIDMYAHKLEREQGRALKLSDCAMASLSRYFWPGNVRELFNLLERLSILHPGKTVKWNDLPDKFRPNQELFPEQMESEVRAQVRDLLSPEQLVLPSEGIDLRPHLAAIERNLMTQALSQSEWVVARAAKLLNLQRTTLVEKMRKFKIQRPEGVTEI
ncbi:sigma-54 interaction domain-containing protein [Pseudohalioglobus lutimaris]|nr:sigma-54 dependent transcriptional regulator [Pseudohalioglobus lutimaris]